MKRDNLLQAQKQAMLRLRQNPEWVEYWKGQIRAAKRGKLTPERLKELEIRDSARAHGMSVKAYKREMARIRAIESAKRLVEKAAALAKRGD